MILITVPKSGTNYLRTLLKIPQEPKVTRNGAAEMLMQIRLYLPGVPNYWGHVYGCPRIKEALKEQGHEIIFLYRDMRDILVSWAHYRYEGAFKYGNIDLAIEHFRPRAKQIAWWEHQADRVIRYEELILNPHDALAGLDYDAGLIDQPTDTFRRGGIGDWKLYFNQLQLLYYQLNYGFCRHWEWSGETR